MVQSLRSSRAVAWQQRVRRFVGSGMTLERFCKEEGVSVSSFCRWRRKVGARPEATRDDEQTPTFRAVRAVLGELLKHDAKHDRGESRC